MQPRTLAIIITLLPLFAVNAAYLMSVNNGDVEWCVPYLHGCTTISQAGRSGDSIFLFRASMMPYAVLLACFWLYSMRWLDKLNERKTFTARLIACIGITGAIFLILYIDFLGTSGEMNRFLRRYGIIIYFSFTPLAQLLLLKNLYGLHESRPQLNLNTKAMHYQRAVLLLILLLGFTSLILKYTGHKTYESENIIEWNFSLLLTLYFAGMIILWNNLSLQLNIKAR